MGNEVSKEDMDRIMERYKDIIRRRDIISEKLIALRTTVKNKELQLDRIKEELANDGIDSIEELASKKVSLYAKLQNALNSAESAIEKLGNIDD